MKNYYVYMLTNKSNQVLYTGVTNNLERRIIEHRTGQASSFTQKYKLHKLVYFEHGFDINEAIAREKVVKGWLRKKKYALIETINPDWKDLSEDWRLDSSLRSE